MKESVKINKLDKIESFREVLSKYTPAPERLGSISNSRIVFMVGPTASGRNTLINILASTERYHYIVSDTTRNPRRNNGVLEQDGVEYWFKKENEFLEGLNKGEYVEAALIHEQQVSGMSFREIDKAMSSGKIPIDEIEVEGAKNLHKMIKNALFVFLLPPSFDVWMERLHGRGDVDEAELIRRLKSARKEITEALNSDFYHFIINNEIHEAAVAVDELANNRDPDPSRQELGRDHAERLIIDIRIYLDSK